MRLLFSCHSYLTAGAERSFVSMVAAARADGHDVVVTIPRPGPVQALLAQSAPGVRQVVIPTGWWMGEDHRGPMGVLRLVRSLLHTVRWTALVGRAKPDAVIANSTVAPAPLLAARLTRTPLAVVVSETMRTNPSLRSIVPRSAIIAVIRRLADATVGVSEYAAQQVGGTDLVEAPPIDVEGAPRDDAPSTVRRAVMLGTLSPEKGQADAVRAVSILRQQGAELRLDLYGDASPEALDALRALASELGVSDLVSHAGVADRPFDVLRAADLSLVCSRNEAYGRVTAESLLVGTPVIGYALGGTAEILRDGGGIAVAPYAAAVADAISPLVIDEQEYAQLRAAAARRAGEPDTFGDSLRTVRRILDRLGRSVRSR
jgi:glycosyltransferase involved in cell wall biosynthesis